MESTAPKVGYDCDMKIKVLMDVEKPLPLSFYNDRSKKVLGFRNLIGFLSAMCAFHWGLENPKRIVRKEFPEDGRPSSYLKGKTAMDLNDFKDDDTQMSAEKSDTWA
ncbi:conserved hypothetical protein [Ricinus communis]|uniref:Uncharacterized protein n=1 Tax=Ricinus communis TaxID=3988 RepID=B9SUP8_RICCO|nr:conserved hypothetical protein [Ricinus communis]